MRLTAVLRTGDERDESPASERNEAFDRRRSLRHPLRLCACTSAPWPGDSPVLILDISQGGLLIEADPSTVSVDDRIEIMLPDKGPVQLRVAWRAGRFFGCEFNQTISPGVVSAALLKADPRVTSAGGSAADAPAGRARFIPELNLSAALYQSLVLWGVLGAAIYFLTR